MKSWKRKLSQLLCAVLYNCNFKGFAEVSIYKGSLKRFCVPGLNCYSCPGAVAACPLGSLQSALVSSKYKIPYYMIGVLLLFGLLFGRIVCGFLCPFGLLQEVLYKLPGRKISKSNLTRKFSYLKYAILLILVVLVPLFMAVPGFCKYICPAGTLEGGIPLVLGSGQLRHLVGNLFIWKVLVLAIVLILAVVMYRSFCRFLCPLGALYGMFSGVALAGIRVDTGRCTHCGKCVAACKMDVRRVGDHECIQCGECMDVCSEDAIEYCFDSRERRKLWNYRKRFRSAEVSGSMIRRKK